MTFSINAESLGRSARVILSITFILAGVGKILHPSEFADAVAAFRILPLQAVNIFAIVLPWVELICGVGILFRSTLYGAAASMLLLNITFMIAAGSAMARGLDIECGCFTLSRAHETVGWGLLLRDAIFILLCILALREEGALRGRRNERMHDELI